MKLTLESQSRGKLQGREEAATLNRYRKAVKTSLKEHRDSGRIRFIPRITQNTKCRKDNVFHFGLPADYTCKGAGTCLLYCNMMRAKCRLPVHIDLVTSNLLSTRSNDFVTVMTALILGLPKGTNGFRAHQVGDFFAQWYVEKWAEIVREVRRDRPEITFYAYTKSLKLDFTSLEKAQLKLIQSEGGKYDHLIDYDKPHSRIFRSREELLDAGYTDCSERDLRAGDPNVTKVGLIERRGTQWIFRKLEAMDKIRRPIWNLRPTGT